MQHCLQCGLGFQPKRGNQIYCSSTCREGAKRDRNKKKETLSDENNNLSIIPVTQLPLLPSPPVSVDLPIALQSTSEIVSNLGNMAVKGTMSQIKFPALSDIFTTFYDPKVKNKVKIIWGCSMAVGGIVGYQLAGKGKRFAGTILGIGVGALVSQLISSQ
jgi:hypothetical protein